VTSFPWLTVLWAIPMVGAALVMVLPASRRTLAKWLALLISIAVLGVTVVVAVGFKPGGTQYQFVESHRWIPSFGTGYILGVDGIALALVVLTAVLVPLLMPAILASLLIVFALSIDDFVVTQYMSSNAATQTIPMILYGTARGGTSTPALNALATIMIVITLGGITLAYFVYTTVGRRLAGAESGVSALRELSGIDAA